jgi:hypothetical protein
MRVIERTIDKRGQRRLTPAIELEGGWTRLALSEQEVIDRDTDHGASEPFHSASKIDRAIERLPSGKLATPAWGLAVRWRAYNRLGGIGPNGLLGPGAPKRNTAKRRRIQTLMQALMDRAVRVVRTARSLKLAFGRGFRVLAADQRIDRRLAYEVSIKNPRQTKLWCSRQGLVRPEKVPLTDYRKLCRKTAVK